MRFSTTNYSCDYKKHNATSSTITITIDSHHVYQFVFNDNDRLLHLLNNSLRELQSNKRHYTFQHEITVLNTAILNLLCELDNEHPSLVNLLKHSKFFNDALTKLRYEQKNCPLLSENQHAWQRAVEAEPNAAYPAQRLPNALLTKNCSSGAYNYSQSQTQVAEDESSEQLTQPLTEDMLAPATPPELSKKTPTSYIADHHSQATSLSSHPMMTRSRSLNKEHSSTNDTATENDKRLSTSANAFQEMASRQRQRTRNENAAESTTEQSENKVSVFSLREMKRK